MRVFNTIGIIGAGAWGTALASAAERAGRTVALWSRASNPEVLRDADALLMVVPAQALRAVTAQLAPHFKPGAPLISCAKGIERGSLAFPTAMLKEAAPAHPVGVLSGPSFAADVSRGLPTAVTLACADEALAAALAAALASPAFRLYHTTDVTGVELGGAAKNVLAIAAGIAAGRGLGASAGAALIARGFAELRRLGTALGAEAETLMGLSGLGDLVLTATSPQSRNFALGEALGRGAPPPDKLAEGAFTAEALVQLAARHGVEMPVSSAVRDVLSGACGVDQAVENLLSRPLKAEAHHPQKCEAVLR